MLTDQPNLEKITRLEIVDDNGRAYTRWRCKVEFSVQDAGRTLKVFISDRCPHHPDCYDCSAMHAT